MHGRSHLPRLALAALAIALIVWAARLGPGGAPGRLEPVGGAATPVVAPGAPAAAAPAAALPAEVGTAPARRAAEALGTDSAPAVTAEPTPVLRGRWILIDEAGLERDVESGRFVLHPADGPPQEIAVEAGGWTAELAPGARFFVEGLELGGRRAAPLDALRAVRAPETGELVLRARRTSDATILVLDAATRAHLAGLEIVGGHVGDGPWDHPGPYAPEDRLALDATSPWLLPAPAEGGDGDALWIRAPEHAWGRLVVPRATGGEHLLLLGPAGTLEVRVTGLDAAVDAWLRLRPPGSDATDWKGVRFETRLGGRRAVELGSLAAGAYGVSLEAGHRYAEPTVLAAADVELRPGERAVLSLDAGAVEGPPTARLAGTVEVPLAWGREAYGVKLRRVDGPPGVRVRHRYVRSTEMRALDAERGVRAWEATDLEVGRWELDVDPFGVATAVDLPPGGRADVRLVVPPPTDVVVRLRDATDGALIGDARVQWMPERAGLETGGVLNGAGEGPPGTWRFRAPAGHVEVWCFPERHRFRREVLVVGADGAEVTLELELACGFELSLRDGDTLLDVTDLEPVIERLDGEGEGRRADVDDLGLVARFTTSAPGLWRVTVAAPPGYAPLAPLEIEVPPGAFVQRTVEVHRAR